MGTMTGTQIISAAAFTLQDTGNVFWTRAELFGYLNDGQRDLCAVKPDAYTLNQNVLLVAGTKQAIPAAAASMARIMRNMGTNGTTPGRVPREIPIEVLDRANPNWHSATASATVMEYTGHPEDPKHFYVSPPQPATNQGYIEALFHGIPTDLGAEANTITLDDQYATALQHYIVYRAYLKEGEFNNPVAAAAHRSEFLALLGAQDHAEAKGKG